MQPHLPLPPTPSAAKISLQDDNYRMPQPSAAASSAAASSSAAAASSSAAAPSRSAPIHTWTDTSSSNVTSRCTFLNPLTPVDYIRLQYDQHSTHWTHGIPIVIDNGTYECRAGYANDTDPRLSFRSLVGRPRIRKDGDYVLVGSELLESDVSPFSQRMKVRSPFESSLLTNFDTMEYLLDYTFSKLGLTSNVSHPIFLTEPISNPNYCRARMNELLFECYDVPAVGVTLAEVNAWAWNRERNVEEKKQRRNDKLDGDCTGDALLISCGYESTSILPIIDSTPLFSHASRLSLGTQHLSSHLAYNLSTIRHTEHASQLNNQGKMMEWIEQYGVCAPEAVEMVDEEDEEQEERKEEMKDDNEDVNMKQSKNQDYNSILNQMALIYDANGHSIPSSLPINSTLPDPIILQLPFTHSTDPTPSAASAADLLAKQEKKEQQRARFKNIMAERKEKKLMDDQEMLREWDELKESGKDGRMSASDFLKELKRRNFTSEQDFTTKYDKLAKSIASRLSGETAEDIAAAAEASLLAKLALPDSEAYPLLHRPDSELTPEELKEKVKQKRGKAIAEQQIARRREKEERLAQEQRQREQEQAEYDANPKAFISNLLQQKEQVLAARDQRQRTQLESTSRRSAASKKRMSLIASIGGSGGSLEEIQKQQKKDKALQAKEDSFGMNDEDWNVYEELKLPGDKDGNESEEEREQLQKIEAKIMQYDPTAATAAASSSTTNTASLTPSDYSLPLWVDRIRTSEILFQPQTLVGVNEAGLNEMLGRMYETLDGERGNRVSQHVLVMGGGSQINGFLNRIESELRLLRPVSETIVVRHARHPQWDAWRGSAWRCRTQPFSQLFFTRAEWQEKGYEYFKENQATNAFAPTPPDEAPELARKRAREKVVR